MTHFKIETPKGDFLPTLSTAAKPKRKVQGQHHRSSGGGTFVAAAFYKGWCNQCGVQQSASAISRSYMVLELR